MAKQVLDKKLADMMAAEGGRGNSTRYSDNSAWLPSDGDDDWYDALHEFDQRRDKTALLSMLCSSEPMSDAVRRHLANLIERYRFVKPRGGTVTPSYHKTPAQQKMWAAKMEVRRLVHEEKPAKRLSVEAAVAVVARKFGLKPTTLQNAYYGRTGDAQRQRRRAAKV
ncbi:MAG: hypothetical protein WBB98_08030 [Xanthobacteraceae bacterium]